MGGGVRGGGVGAWRRAFLGEVGLKPSLKEQEQISSSWRREHPWQGPSGAKAQGPHRRAQAAGRAGGQER